jgi:hypothetical protein
MPRTGSSAHAAIGAAQPVAINREDIDTQQVIGPILAQLDHTRAA